MACPADVNVQAYISLISNGRFDEALEVIRRQIPFPAVCGRVCYSPCEEACQRKNIDSPLSIRLLKRLVSEQEFKSEKAAKAESVHLKHKERIAIIGAGPAGLTAAYELRKTGFPVRVYERDKKPGGMLRSYLPLYRLPEEVLDADIRYIKDTGVEIVTNVSIGGILSLEDFWTAGYKAIFIAVGAQRSRSMNIEGEDLEGVLHALDFLRGVHSGLDRKLEDRVSVIGGGNVAIDAARTAIRLGHKDVTVIYRRLKEDMPANPEEVEEAEKEGVNFLFLSTPTRILGCTHVEEIECVKMRPGEPDETGRRRPIPIPNSEFLVSTDVVIEAVGETPDLTFLPDGIKVTKWNTIDVDPATFQTNLEGVFAGGDVVTGPSSVIEAIASGKKAARAIELFLHGGNLDFLRVDNIEEYSWVKEEGSVEKKPRQEESYLPVEKRKDNFDEVELGFTREQSIKEALRCLHCGPCAQCLIAEGFSELELPEIEEENCSGCGICVSVCPFNALSKDENNVVKVDESLCKGCGICSASCPERAVTIKKVTGDRILNMTDYGCVKSERIEE